MCAGNMGFTIKCTRLECLSLYMCRMFTYHTLLLFLWSTQDIQSHHFSVTFPLWIWCELEEQIRRMRWHPTPVLLPGKSHGQRSLVGCSPWGHEESDMTERLHFHFSLSCIGEGNGNPLQCSCLENPRDRGAWWAAVHGVGESRTRPKRLSSSGSSSRATN